jgi:rSAM/selenodomain-associated transferase 2
MEKFNGFGPRWGIMEITEELQGTVLSEAEISVIIPTLGEEAALEACLKGLFATGVEECLVVDGGSGDATVKVASRYATHVLVAQGGRALQFSAGAAQATGRILCFLHADTTMPADWREQVLEVIDLRGCVAGAFRLGLEGDRWAWRVIEAGANLRSRWLGLPYGDQALFVRTDVFTAMGGFRPLPFMEDVEWVIRLRRFGPLGLTRGRVTTSPRRWEREGIIRTTLRNNLALLGYFIGVEPSTLHQWYFRPRSGHATQPTTDPEGASDERPPTPS